VALPHLTGETARCFKAGFFDAAFIGEYLQNDPTQEYQYRPEDAYASRCGALHTGRHHTYAPGTKGIAYILSPSALRKGSEAPIR
jgi:hypothetical protein